MAEEIKCKVWWDEENGVARILTHGCVDEDESNIIISELRSLAKSHGGRISVLDDLSYVEKVPAKARQIFAQETEADWLIRMAFIGASVTVRVIATLIFGFKKEQTKI